MREADIECKVAHSPVHSYRTTVASLARPFQSTRSRKLTAESAFCCEWNLCSSVFSAQTKRAKVEMTSKNSPQKSISGQMNVHFALGSSFAHIRPSRRNWTCTIAALVSLSKEHPHSQECQRSLNAFLRTVPQVEHTCEMYLGSTIKLGKSSLNYHIYCHIT